MKSITLACFASLWLAHACAHAQQAKPEVDNGTDPTRFTTSAALIYEYNDLANDVTRQIPRIEVILPLGEQRHYNLRLTVPAVSNDVAGNDGFALGDVALRMSHVFGVTRHRGMVVHGELIFDTAKRDELGSGKDVFKGTFIYAHFRPNGSIFAPAFVQSVDVAGDRDRADVNLTTIDFYYVPKLKDPHNYITWDPALNFDWENDKDYVSLAVTFGRVVGEAFGGHAQLYVKPSVLVGSERPGDWSMEVGFKVLGF
jgi:hypothetical protein